MQEQYANLQSQQKALSAQHAELLDHCRSMETVILIYTKKKKTLPLTFLFFALLLIHFLGLYIYIKYKYLICCYEVIGC